ncbi:MAG: type II toxin-antitoxin system RelE/ParE family toxin [Hormoscilla sp. GM102CHS1]|nr:type II toxin-antitoxin system RelE/ParE family toxin [Hormoscilla sp. GM102CHS1]
MCGLTLANKLFYITAFKLLNRVKLKPNFSRSYVGLWQNQISLNAWRFVEEFEKKCRNLVEFPNMGRSYAEIKPSLWGIPIEGYIILYRVIENGVEIVRVVSGYRDLPSLFFESDDG